jgi:spore maturation protein CgeB
LVSAPWDDTEGLFEAGRDYLPARDGPTMQDCLRMLLADASAARELAARGRATVLARHTCAHRVNELMDICSQMGLHTRTALAEANA